MPNNKKTKCHLGDRTRKSVFAAPDEELEGKFPILDFLRGEGVLSAVIYPVNSEPVESHI